MPLYDWKCENPDCGEVFEEPAGMSRQWTDCPSCNWCAQKKFTPTKNFLIPERFRRSSTWHLPDGKAGPDTGPASGNSSVHAPKRPSFREKFEENWR